MSVSHECVWQPSRYLTDWEAVLHPPAYQPLPSDTEHKCLLSTSISLALLLIFLPSVSSKELCSVLDLQIWAI